MKKITLLALLVLSFIGFGQSKSTGTLSYVTGVSANLTLNNTTATATLVLSGPNDRWFAIKFGSFVHPMQLGVDGVYWNGTTLIDGNEGEYVGLYTDNIQSWTVTSSTLSGTVRNITATRPFNTGDANDFPFVYSNSTIDIAIAKGGIANYNMNSTNKHCAACRTVNYATPLTTLGVEDFSLNASSVFPNPSDGSFTITTKSALETVTIYSQTGALIKTIEVKDAKEKAEVLVNNLSTGVYLIELKSSTDKSWKKVMVN